MKNSDGTFELSQTHLVEKTIKHVRLEVSASIKAREISAVKPLVRKDKYSLGRKFVWNYNAAVSMLSYIQGSTRPEISIDVQKCARFSLIYVFCNSVPSDELQCTL